MKKTGYKKLIIITVCVLVLCAVIPTGVFYLFDHNYMNKQVWMNRQPIESSEGSLSVLEKIQMVRKKNNGDRVTRHTTMYNDNQEDVNNPSIESLKKESAIEEMKQLFVLWKREKSPLVEADITWDIIETEIIVDFETKKSFYVDNLYFSLEQKNVSGEIILDEDTGKILSFAIFCGDKEWLQPIFSKASHISRITEIWEWLEPEVEQDEAMYQLDVVMRIAEIYSDYLGMSLTECIAEGHILEMYSKDTSVSSVAITGYEEGSYLININFY